MTTILLADDHEIFRQGLQMLLSAQPDFKIVGQASDGVEAMQIAERLRPEVAVIDMLMPGLNGLELAYQMHQRLPGTRIVVLSMHDDESYVVTALQNGASAYVLKDSSAADLVQAVRAAAAGQRFLSPSLAERAIQAYINQKNDPGSSGISPYSQLTQREREILHLSLNGLNTAEVARRLTISVRTVEAHRAHLMHKLGVHSQEELLALARQQKFEP